MTLLLALLSSPALASVVGTPELDGAVLSRSTLLQVDILDHTTETIAWTGGNSVLAFDPNGVFAGVVASGTSLVPTVDGTYTLSLVDDEVSWQVEVTGATGGRVWSETWSVETPGFASGQDIDIDMYAHLTANGGDATVQLDGHGMAGTIVEFSATSLGVPGTPGRSAPDNGQVLTDGWPLYLQPPEIAVGISPFTALLDVEYTPTEEACDNLDDEGSFSFLTTVTGVWHVVCDVSGDGVLDFTDPADLHLTGRSSIGFNLVEWDGRLAGGALVPAGFYDCQVTVTPMEVHAVFGDLETGFEGLRLFRADPAVAATPLPMFWDDSLVEGGALQLPDGQSSMVASGHTGLSSGDPLQPHDALVNSRAWGAFTQFGKGDRAFLDTWTWIDPVSSPVFSIEVTDPGDIDGDGLSDLLEVCELCTSEYIADTDGDGLSDGEEVQLDIDPCDQDTDDDEVPDGVEVPNPLVPVDTDGDGLIDPKDDDDDGDNVPTADEDYEPDGDPTNDDTDGDGTPDYLDVDDDGDGLLTNPTEDVNSNGDPRDDDTDGDGTPDYLDPDIPVDTSATADTGTTVEPTGDSVDTGTTDPTTAETADTVDTVDTGTTVVTTAATADTVDTGTTTVVTTAETADTDDTGTTTVPTTAETADTDDTGTTTVPTTAKTADTDDTGITTVPTTAETADTDDTGTTTPLTALTGLTALTAETGTTIITILTGDTAATADTDDTSDQPLTGLTATTGDTDDTALPPLTALTGATAETGTPPPTALTGETALPPTGETGLPTAVTGETGAPTVPQSTADTVDTGTPTDPLVPVVEQYYEGGCSCAVGHSGLAGGWLGLVVLGLVGRRRR